MDKELLEAVGQMMDTKLEAQRKEIMHDVKVLMDTEVQTKFNLLAEGQADILDKLVPRSRVDDLEDEVKFLKSMIRQINEDVQRLKEAN